MQSATSLAAPTLDQDGAMSLPASAFANPGSTRLTRRHFMSSTTAASLAAGSTSLAAQAVQVPADVYQALVVGRGDAAERITHGWKREPAIVQLRHAGDLRDSLRALEQYRPELLAVAGTTIPPSLVSAAAARGVRAVYIDAPLAKLDEWDGQNQAFQRHNLIAALADSVRYSQAYAAVAAAVDSGQLGRLLEIRCTMANPTATESLTRCREAMALAMALGGGPRDCYGRIYRGSKRLDSDEATAAFVNGQLSPHASFHASLRLESGATAHLDCSRTRSALGTNPRVTITGSRGVVELSGGVASGIAPIARWRKAAPWAAARLAAPWQPLGEDSQEQIGSRTTHASGAAHAALRDLIASLEGDRQPLVNLPEACAAGAMLRLCVDSHAALTSIRFEGAESSLGT